MCASIINEPSASLPDTMELHDQLYESLLKAQALTKMLSCNHSSENFENDTIEWYMNALLDIINSAMEAYEMLQKRA